MVSLSVRYPPARVTARSSGSSRSDVTIAGTGLPPADERSRFVWRRYRRGLVEVPHGTVAVSGRQGDVRGMRRARPPGGGAAPGRVPEGVAVPDGHHRVDSAVVAAAALLRHGSQHGSPRRTAPPSAQASRGIAYGSRRRGTAPCPRSPEHCPRATPHFTRPTRTDSTSRSHCAAASRRSTRRLPRKLPSSSRGKRLSCARLERAP